MSGPIEIILILAAVAYVMVRRVMGEPAEGKRMLILPAVLLVIGISDVSGSLKTPMSVVFLVATAAISVVLGGLRGASVRLSERDGLAFVRYTGVTIALWVANLAIKFGGNLVLGIVDPKDASSVSNSLFLTLGAGMLVEGLVVLARALHGDARVIWSKGKDGAPHQMSPFLDNMQRSLNGGATSSTDYQPTEYGPFTQYSRSADHDEFDRGSYRDADRTGNRGGYDQRPAAPVDGLSSMLGGLRDARSSRRADRRGRR